VGEEEMQQRGDEGGGGVLGADGEKEAFTAGVG